MRIYFLALAFVVLLVVAIFGWRGRPFTEPPREIFSDMKVQPKVKAQAPSDFFADGRGSRPPVPGTVPQGFENASPALRFSSGTSYEDTGRMGEGWGNGIPMPVTPELMARGRERYGIFCAACHGASGDGESIAKRFGLNTVQSVVQARVRAMSDGELFHVISDGRNTMMGYGDRIPVPDRWAIVVYLRALQKSQGGATAADVPEEELAKLGKETR